MGKVGGYQPCLEDGVPDCRGVSLDRVCGDEKPRPAAHWQRQRIHVLERDHLCPAHSCQIPSLTMYSPVSRICSVTLWQTPSRCRTLLFCPPGQQFSLSPRAK